MSYNLFLDDVRYPKTVTWVELPLVNWIIVRDYKQFVDIILKDGVPTRISFDHDLSYLDNGKTENFIEKTGYDCANWLVEYCLEKNLPFPETFVHSHNPSGAERIRQVWSHAKENENSLRELYKNKNKK